MRPTQPIANRRVTRGSTKHIRQQQQLAKKSLLTGKLYQPDGLCDHPSEIATFRRSGNSSSSESRRFKDELDAKMLSLLNQAGQDSSEDVADTVMTGNAFSAAPQRQWLTQHRQSMGASHGGHQVDKPLSASDCNQRYFFASPNVKGTMREDPERNGQQSNLEQRGNCKSTVILPFSSPVVVKTTNAGAGGSASKYGSSRQLAPNSEERISLSKPAFLHGGQERPSETLGQTRDNNTGVIIQSRNTRSTTRQNPSSPYHVTLKSATLQTAAEANNSPSKQDQRMREKQADEAEAFFSLLRGIAKLRMIGSDNQLEIEPGSHIQDQLEVRRYLRRKVALEHLQRKQIKRHMLNLEDRKGAVLQSSQGEREKVLGALQRVIQDTQHGQKLMLDPAAAAKAAQLLNDMNIHEAQSNLKQHLQPGERDTILDDTIQQYKKQFIAQHQPSQERPQPPGAMMDEQQMSLESYREEAMIGQHTLLVLEDAIRIIDSIGRLGQERPEVFLPIIQQATISMEELDQVKGQLFLQYQETSQQTLLLTQLLESGNVSQLTPRTEAQREKLQADSINSYNALLQMTKQFTDLYQKLTAHCLDNEGQKALEVGDSQATINRMVETDIPQMPQQADTELQQSILLKQQLQDLMNNSLDIDGDVEDPETLQKIQELRSVLKQIIGEQELQIESQQPPDRQVAPSAEAEGNNHQAPAPQASANEMKHILDNLENAVGLLQQKDDVEAVLELQSQLNQYLGVLQTHQQAQGQAQAQNGVNKVENEQTFEMLQQMAQLLQILIQQEQEANSTVDGPGAISQKTQNMVFQLEELIQQFSVEQAQAKQGVPVKQPEPQVPQAVVPEGEEDQDVQLQLVYQMLEPYGSDPSVKERLFKIKALQSIIKNGTPEQKLQAQAGIIELVEYLQSIDLEPFKQQIAAAEASAGMQQNMALTLGEQEQLLQQQLLQHQQVSLLDQSSQNKQERYYKIHQLQQQQQMLEQLLQSQVSEENQNEYLILQLQLEQQIQMLLQQATEEEQQAQAQAQIAQIVDTTGTHAHQNNNFEKNPLAQNLRGDGAQMFLSNQFNQDIQAQLAYVHQLHQQTQENGSQNVTGQQEQSQSALLAMQQKAQASPANRKSLDGQYQQLQAPELTQQLQVEQKNSMQLGQIKTEVEKQPQLAYQHGHTHSNEHTQPQQLQLTDEQKLIVLQNLSLNIEEQNQLNMVLQDSEGFQLLYKESPQKLIEMLQHLKHLEEAGEQMKQMIQMQNSPAPKQPGDDNYAGQQQQQQASMIQGSAVFNNEQASGPSQMINTGFQHPQHLQQMQQPSQQSQGMAQPPPKTPTQQEQEQLQLMQMRSQSEKHEVQQLPVYQDFYQPQPQPQQPQQHQQIMLSQGVAQYGPSQTNYQQQFQTQMAGAQSGLTGKRCLNHLYVAHMIKHDRTNQVGRVWHGQAPLIQHQPQFQQWGLQQQMMQIQNSGSPEKSSGVGRTPQPGGQPVQQVAAGQIPLVGSQQSMLNQQQAT